MSKEFGTIKNRVMPKIIQRIYDDLKDLNEYIGNFETNILPNNKIFLAIHKGKLKDLQNKTDEQIWGELNYHYENIKTQLKLVDNVKKVIKMDENILKSLKEYSTIKQKEHFFI